MRISRWIAAAVVSVAASALMGASAQQASAQSTPIAYQGTMYLTGPVNPVAADACAQAGWSGFEHLTSVFRPRLEGSEPPAAISILNSRYAGLIQARGGNGRFGRQGPVTFREFRSRASFAVSNLMNYRMFRTTPANIRPDTLGVTIQGRFNNLAGARGCHVTFQAGYVQRP